MNRKKKSTGGAGRITNSSDMLINLALLGLGFLILFSLNVALCTL